jgi:GWxTD domain-containing protein
MYHIWKTLRNLTPMKRLLYFFFLISFISNGQPLRDMNFKHWYSYEAPSLEIRPVRQSGKWTCFYLLQVRDTSQSASNFELSWELRNSLNDKEGTQIADTIQQIESNRRILQGSIVVNVSENVKYIVARVTSTANQRQYYYYVALEPKYPETTVLTVGDKPLTERFIRTGNPISIKHEGRYFVARYDDNFPTAPLAFSEALGRVPKQMRIDSSFTVNGMEEFSLPSRGLYLIQKDTTSAEGIALRAEEDYPRYSKLRSLAAPLIYICTNQEFEKIREANGEKKAFDKVILGITKDADRAKRLIRAYFKRIELANEFFTSYKEGWKTDRGMIYIIFGPPDEVFRFTDREVWNYKNPEYKVDFNFVRSPSLFDPQNYVLIREKKYKETWYEVIDLWRNARF